MRSEFRLIAAALVMAEVRSAAAALDRWIRDDKDAVAGRLDCEVLYARH